MAQVKARPAQVKRLLVRSDPIVKLCTKRVRPHVRWPVALIALTLLPLTGLQAAAADPINDKQAQAARLSHEIEVKGQRVAQLAEQVDQARLHQAEVTTKLAHVESDVAQADARAPLHRAGAAPKLASVDSPAARAAARAGGAGGGLRGQAMVLSVRGSRHVLSGALTDPTQATYVSALSSGEQDVIDRMREAR